MWSHLIKLASLSKGALVVGVAASAALVSTAEFSNAPSHDELPSPTPQAIVSAPPAAIFKADAVVTAPKATEKATAEDPNTTPAASPKIESGLAHGEIPGVIKECVEKYLAIREQGDSASIGDRRSTGEVCRAALAVSGLTGAEFWAKFGLDKPSTAPTTDTTKTTKTADLAEQAKGSLSPEALHLAQECVTKYNARSADASATCKRAIELSGLTSSEFAAKFLFTTSGDTKPSTATTKPSPTAKPETATKPPTSTEVSQLIATCLQMYAAFGKTSTDTRAVSEACGVAIRASGLSSTAFWAKYHPSTN